MLGRMLQSLGFETIVLLSQNPETGMIDPDESAHIPGLHLIDDADLLILQLRFRHLADDDMKHIADYIASGKPVTGIRTSTHAFAYPNDSESIYADWSWNRSGGFGQAIRTAGMIVACHDDLAAEGFDGVAYAIIVCGHIDLVECVGE